MDVVYKYNKLLGRLRELELTQNDLAEFLGISPATLSVKLNNKSEFTQAEIYSTMFYIKEPLAKINDYFFTC